MFHYYLKSLHNFREQNLEVGKATSQAYLDLVSSSIEGQYVLSKAMLHQGVRTLNDQHPDLVSFWSICFDDEEHQQLVLNWFDTHVEKNNYFHQLIFAAMKQHASGLNALTTELILKLKHDLPETYAPNLESVKATLESVTEAEINLANSAEANLLSAKLPMSRVKSTVGQARIRKAAVKTVASKGKVS